MRIWNDGPEVFSSYASCKSCSEITAWMSWPLNCDMGAELSDLLTTSAYIPRAAYVQKHRKCELRACLIGRVPRHSSPLWNAKSQIRSLVCTLHNSNIAITSLVCTLHKSECAIQMIIQITLFALVWKHSKLPLMCYPTYTLQKCDITSCSHMVHISKKKSLLRSQIWFMHFCIVTLTQILCYGYGECAYMY